jgi:hypothetical protein
MKRWRIHIVVADPAVSVALERDSGEPITVGRSARCDVCIPVDNISLRQLVLRVNDEGHVLAENLGGQGTFYEREKFKRARIEPGRAMYCPASVTVTRVEDISDEPR